MKGFFGELSTREVNNLYLVDILTNIWTTRVFFCSFAIVLLTLCKSKNIENVTCDIWNSGQINIIRLKLFYVKRKVGRSVEMFWWHLLMNDLFQSLARWIIFAFTCRTAVLSYIHWCRATSTIREIGFQFFLNFLE